jgi:methylated-DNA-[protein]-cysteine S-methyltransferase
MELYCKSLSSPVGKITVYANDRAVVGLFIGNQDKKGLSRKFSKALGRGNPVIEKAEEELDAYFEGRLTEFTAPVEVSGTDFQKAVWKSLQAIGHGQLRTYSDVARDIARPTAVRAVGGAIGSNPISIIIPCHRVIGSNATLTGFGGGLPVKQRLLEIEGHTIADLAIVRPQT